MTLKIGCCDWLRRVCALTYGGTAGYNIVQGGSNNENTKKMSEIYTRIMSTFFVCQSLNRGLKMATVTNMRDNRNIRMSPSAFSLYMLFYGTS